MRTGIKNTMTGIAFGLLGAFIGSALNSFFPFVVCVIMGAIVIAL